MVRTRLIVFASAAALVFSFVAPMTAHASLGGTCRSDLIKDRFDAVDSVIDASHSFTRDVTSFIDIKAGSPDEIRSDYRSSIRDLKQDLRSGLRDISDARGQALTDLQDSCGNVSTNRVKRELTFYTRMDHNLFIAYRKARVALRNAYRAAIASCCAS